MSLCVLGCPGVIRLTPPVTISTKVVSGTVGGKKIVRYHVFLPCGFAGPVTGRMQSLQYAQK